MKQFSKKLLFADYLIAVALIAGYFLCVGMNGLYTKNVIEAMIHNGIDISAITVPQLFSLDGFGIVLGAWTAQLGVSSGAYYMMSKSDHKIQLPMAMLDTMPDDIKNQLDINQVITTVLSTTDN